MLTPQVKMGLQDEKTERWKAVWKGRSNRMEIPAKCEGYWGKSMSRAMGKQWVMMGGISTCVCTASALTPGLEHNPCSDKLTYMFFHCLASASCHDVSEFYMNHKQRNPGVFFVFFFFSFHRDAPSYLHLSADCSSNCFPAGSGN